jgi:diguanylate cyclase (GGDEF)-like protein
LTLFFVLIVVFPMIAVGVLVAKVTDASRTGKADARLDAGLDTALVLARDDVADARQAAAEIGADPDLGTAMFQGAPREQINAVLERLARETGAKTIILRSPSGDFRAGVGLDPTIARATTHLTGAGGKTVAVMGVSTTTPNGFLADVHRLTGRDAAIVSGGSSTLASTNNQDRETSYPTPGSSKTVNVNDEDVRVASAGLPGGRGYDLVLFGPVESKGFFASSSGVIIVLGAFFVLAFIFALVVQRTLQGQVADMLAAAKRIGSGDFSQKVPVTGRDEMGGLADEFNKMSDKLMVQMNQLRRQQTEIDRSVRRIGEAFASGLDRSALLKIVAETAISSCDADYGLVVLTGREGAEAEVGRASESLQDAVLEAESEANRTGEVAEVNGENAHALSGPLRRIGEPGSKIGVMTVARRSGPFERAEQDVFRYLIGQAAASIENVALHELVSEQAVTDDLTQLPNKRAFRNFAEREAARASRFSHPLSLLVLDIDNFKSVNDTYGHLQGDEVLRRVARSLDAESREIDMPARYGGEEFVLGLPETGLQGAAELAERVRQRIEAERIPLVERDGELQVTASIGVATLPADATDVESLIGAADAALYAAKRGGKNRVITADGNGPNGGRETPFSDSSPPVSSPTHE